MIRQLNSHDIYIQLSNCPQTYQYHNTGHFSKENAALCHSSDKVKVITQSLYTTTDDGVFSLDEVDGA